MLVDRISHWACSGGFGMRLSPLRCDRGKLCLARLLPQFCHLDGRDGPLKALFVLWMNPIGRPVAYGNSLHITQNGA